MGRRERVIQTDQTVETAAWIAANPEAARELGLVSAEQIVADAARAVQDASRIAETSEGHSGETGAVQELIV